MEGESMDAKRNSPPFYQAMTPKFPQPAYPPDMLVAGENGVEGRTLSKHKGWEMGHSHK